MQEYEEVNEEGITSDESNTEDDGETEDESSDDNLFEIGKKRWEDFLLKDVYPRVSRQVFGSLTIKLSFAYVWVGVLISSVSYHQSAPALQTILSGKTMDQWNSSITYGTLYRVSVLEKA